MKYTVFLTEIFRKWQIHEQWRSTVVKKATEIAPGELDSNASQLKEETVIKVKGDWRSLIK